MCFAGALEGLGNCHVAQGDESVAIGFFQQAHDIYEALRQPYGTAIQLGNLSVCYERLDDHGKATMLLQQAATLLRNIGAAEDHALMKRFSGALSRLR